jgi:DNA-binding NarL/FixJ family response regulator
MESRRDRNQNNLFDPNELRRKLAMHPYCIVLADDHVLFRQGIKRIIEEAEGLEIVGEVSDGLELIELLKHVTSHMVILDISMPNLRGIEATKEIKTTHPDVKVLILTMHKDMEYLYNVISAGAEGYLLKEDADTELFSAIETIRQGETYISPLLAKELKDDLIQIYRGKFQHPYENLSTREREIVKLIAEGKSTKEIADLLFISARTVEHHRAHIMEKLNIKKTADLIKYAIRKGYTTLNP